MKNKLYISFLFVLLILAHGYNMISGNVTNYTISNEKNGLNKNDLPNCNKGNNGQKICNLDINEEEKGSLKDNMNASLRENIVKMDPVNLSNSTDVTQQQVDEEDSRYMDDIGRREKDLQDKNRTTNDVKFSRDVRDPSGDIDADNDEVVDDEVVDDEVVDDEVVDDEVVDDEVVDDEMVEDEMVDDEEADDEVEDDEAENDDLLDDEVVDDELIEDEVNYDKSSNSMSTDEEHISPIQSNGKSKNEINEEAKENTQVHRIKRVNDRQSSRDDPDERNDIFSMEINQSKKFKYENEKENYHDDGNTFCDIIKEREGNTSFGEKKVSIEDDIEETKEDEERSEGWYTIPTIDSKAEDLLMEDYTDEKDIQKTADFLVESMIKLLDEKGSHDAVKNYAKDLIKFFSNDLSSKNGHYA
ncbi:hypothetical protein PGO_061960 [Plasmodium gonderi]|uniref:Merozoite surface protein 3 n=1 Tax=Plasmodium gonderi TaxID=77519 RepID=A0A1Y1JBZ1_PLAGO|nr:hypothetical protein PGO_061960 [Plasmodium gonderi]GAW80051.1 hypothetical protein PGO_061960 [Plasmodium gonderi]